MLTPTVTEITRALEPVDRDTFMAGEQALPDPLTSRYGAPQRLNRERSRSSLLPPRSRAARSGCPPQAALAA